MHIFQPNLRLSRSRNKRKQLCSMAKYLLWTKNVNFTKLTVSGAVPKMSLESIELKLLWEPRAWTDRIILWNSWTPLGLACLLIYLSTLQLVLEKDWEQM